MHFLIFQAFFEIEDGGYDKWNLWRLWELELCDWDWLLPMAASSH